MALKIALARSLRPSVPRAGFEPTPQTSPELYADPLHHRGTNDNILTLFDYLSIYNIAYLGVNEILGCSLNKIRYIKLERLTVFDPRFGDSQTKEWRKGSAPWRIGNRCQPRFVTLKKIKYCVTFIIRNL